MVLGASISMQFPAQPFLANNMGVSIETFTSIYMISELLLFLFFTVETIMNNSCPGGAAGVIASITAAFCFKKYLCTASAKMMSFSVVSFVTAMCVFAMPLVTSFQSMVQLVAIRDFLYTAWGTASAGLLVYMVGPVGDDTVCILKILLK